MKMTKRNAAARALKLLRRLPLWCALLMAPPALAAPPPPTGDDDAQECIARFNTIDYAIPAHAGVNRLPSG